ncbi:hypothetical protein POSPLADRAFT_1140940 [Postia placenta MAD-698-R-SB12]|uniref:Uncharacterized protein n=1 Tax=Postia placenta MAD-698-R-SB12 TaxID=670580 RepID=A0A1X6N1P7_9APHY|nr:hypothetical protein POSPLADRAFT_1140940 [Postia placenta MAD-698-R-SB12]OSX62538.1 hypothetical protein POSPLADRAFT_1140940 [Postia placenta MAD-698-R-SB12]
MVCNKWIKEISKYNKHKVTNHKAFVTRCAILVVNGISISLLITNIVNSVGIIADVLNTILLSRLLLNLRQVRLNPDADISSLPIVSSFGFASQVIGPLGQPVDYHSPEVDLTASQEDAEDVQHSQSTQDMGVDEDDLEHSLFV